MFSDCPIGVWFEEALQCSMFQCTGTYHYIVATAAVRIGGPNRETETGTISGIAAKDIFITDCIFYVPGSAAVRGSSIGLDLISAEHVRLKSVRFEDFYQGILIRPGYAGTDTSPSGYNVVRCFFTDVTVLVGTDSTTSEVAGNALTIQPQGTGQQIAELTFVGCAFEPGTDVSITSTEGAGIIVDANGSLIDTVRFVSCHACRWNGPGMSIGVPGGVGTLQNIEVLGGMYSGNNLLSGSYPYGVAIFGPASGVRVIGVSCVGEYEFVKDDSDRPSPQQSVGIFVDSGASEITIDGCDVRLNADYGIVVNAASDVVISGCNVSSNAVGGSGAGVQVNAGATNVIIVSVRPRPS